MNIKKYKDVVHYIIYAGRIAPDHQKIGSTKLNKLLYFSDFLNYYKYRLSITGDTYIRHQYGPVPKDIDKIVESLKEDKKIIEIPEIFESGQRRKTLWPNTEPSLDNLEKRDLCILHSVIERMLQLSAEQISKVSHDIVWKCFRIGEEIPYRMSHILFGKSNIEDKDIEWARSVFKRSSRTA